MMRLNVVMYADGLVEVTGGSVDYWTHRGGFCENRKYFEQYSHEPNIATPRFWITQDIEMTEERRLFLETRRKPGYAALGVTERHLASRDYSGHVPITQA